MMMSTSTPIIMMLLAVALGSNSSRGGLMQICEKDKKNILVTPKNLEDRGEDQADDMSKIGGLPTVWWSPIQVNNNSNILNNWDIHHDLQHHVYHSVGWVWGGRCLLYPSSITT